jgi:hypothetical protein
MLLTMMVDQLLQWYTLDISFYIKLVNLNQVLFRVKQACYEGSYKVVELLLEEGVDKDTKNRWRNTPLEEAISSRQFTVNLPFLPTHCSGSALYRR